MAKPRFVIVSVYHTGTRTLRHLTQHVAPEEARQVHCETHAMSQILGYAEAGIPLIVPLRQPQACWQSWLNRPERHLEEFEEQWLNLMSLPIDLFVAVDLPIGLAALEPLRVYAGGKLFAKHGEMPKIGHEERVPGSRPYQPMPYVSGLQEWICERGYFWLTGWLEGTFVRPYWSPEKLILG